MAKRVRISANGNDPWYTLPGNTAELRNEAGELNDTIFGQDFSSGETGLISWTLSANAIYKGFAGYIVSIKKSGTPVVMSGEAMSLVSGKTYRPTSSAHRLFDLDTAIVVKDNGVDHTADVKTIDYLSGQVTFKSAYTVTGPVTMDGAYMPSTEVAGSKSFTLTQTAETIDETDIPTAKVNGGCMVYSQGLKTVTLELSGIYKVANNWLQALKDRDTVIIEINPDNGGHSLCRGIFKFASQGQSGDVGALEEETLSLRLSVPDKALLAQPFSWYHEGSSTLNAGIKTCLDAWLAGDNVFVEYLPDGTDGHTGKAVVTDLSLTGGLEAMNEFTVNLQGSGAIEEVV